MWKPIRTIVLLCSLAGAPSHAQEGSPSIQTFTLPKTNLADLGIPGCSAEALRQAHSNGLKFTDLPSIGSGLARTGENEFAAITDRGPNGDTASAGADGGGRRFFPLPRFCPSIVRLQLVAGQIRIAGVIPLRDTAGSPLTGLSNGEGEERLYESPGATSPLPYDPNGVDPESLRLLPDGSFLISEEYSPSLLVVSPNGRVLMRYTPASKPLTGATYPVKPILPAAFAARRVNKGFESLAVSGDGRFAWVILQSPLGDERDPRLAESRVIRVLQLDVSRPLDARVTGEYLVLASPAARYPAGQKQSKISWSDADWLAPDTLLIVERGKGEAKLLRIDLGLATNILGHKDESLVFEQAKDLGALGVRTAEVREVFSTRGIEAIDSDKIEGLAVLSPTEIALVNDNDFGIGENVNGAPSKLWRIRMSAPLPLAAPPR